MGFIKNHLAPTLHNAIGGIIAAAVLALLAFIKPLRDFVFSVAVFPVPLWFFGVCLLVCVLALIRLRKTPSAQHIEIRSAHYGAGFAQVDVTHRVRERVHDGVLNVLATTEALACHDPYHGATKSLTIDYTIDGRDRTVQITEGSRLILP